MQHSEIYDWLSPAWQSLLIRPEVLPHALLLTGQEGVGKGLFAEALATRLLCETAQGVQVACGVCDGCRLVASDNHPDFRKITLEEEVGEESTETTSNKKGKGAKKSAAAATQIKIHQIRLLEDFVYVGSHRQGKRVAVIDPADAMNTAAANALLKILEEPPSSVYFILVSSNEKRLLPTMRSRCRQIAFGTPPIAAAARWLKAQKIANPDRLLALVSGSPLKALALARDGIADIVDEAVKPLQQQTAEPVAVAAHWDGMRRKHAAFDLDALVDAVQKWIYDVARTQRGTKARYFPGREKELTAAAAKASASRLQRCHADLLKIRAVVRHPLNELLLLEDMAARCVAGLSLAGRHS